MRISIAVATTSGKAYYRLVSELKSKEIPFIAVKPDEMIPLNIEVAITTKSEKRRIHFPTILIYDEEKDPSFIIEEALGIIRGKRRYNNLVVGVDPGKEFGVAIIGDGKVLQTENTSNEEETARVVLEMLKRYNGDQKTVKIGDGADIYRYGLIRRLDKMLSQEIHMESVKEGGTTKNSNIISKPVSKNASSAIRIAMRYGKKIVLDS